MKNLKTLLLALALLAGRAASSGQVIDFTGPALVEHFDSMGSNGTITPAGWYVGWPQGGTDGGALRTTNVVVNNGGTVAPGGNAGFNCGNTPDRALGVAATSTGNPPGPNRFVEVQIHNNTGQSITNFDLRYDGEQWRTAGNSGQAYTNYFRFSTNGIDYVPMGDTFDFRAPVLSPANLPLDGNAASNRIPNIGGSYTPATPVAPGLTIYLRWLDLNDPGTDPVVAIDNFSFSVLGNLQPVSIVSQPQSATAVVGEAASLTIGALGFPIFYQWFRNAQPVANATNATLLFSNPGTNDSGIYFVVLSNQFNAVTSQVASLSVSLVLPVILISPTNTAAYLGGSLLLSVTHTRQVAYQWWKNGQPINGATQQSLTLANLQLADAGAYQVSLSNAAGIVTTANAIVTVLTPSIPFDRYTNFWSYHDSGVDQGTAWREPSFDETGWPSGRSVLGTPLNEPLPGTLSVTTPLVLSNAGVRVITHYFIHRFTLPAPPQNVVLTLASVIDDGAVFYLNGVELGRRRMPAGNISYATIASTATDIGTTPGRIDEFAVPSELLVPGENRLAVEVHQGGAAVSSDVIFGCGLNLIVVPDSLLAITNLPSSRVALQGDAITFSAQVSGVGARYQWFKNGTVLPGATRRDLVLSNASPADATLYQVVISNSLNSVSGNVALAVVAPLTNRIVMADFEFATLPSLVFSPTPVRYQWLLNEIELPHQTNAMLDLGTATLDHSGNYSLRVTHGTDSATAAPAKLFVKPWFYTTLYVNDFNAPVSSEWSLTNRSATPVARRSFLGEFGNNVVRLTLTNVPPHTEVNVSCDLFVIRTWDGHASTDRWRLAVSNSPIPVEYTFASVGADSVQPQSYPEPFPGFDFPATTGASEVRSLGYYFQSEILVRDNVYLLSRSFQHSSNVLVIEFSGAGLEPLLNESWGLENLVVSVGNISSSAAPLLVLTPVNQLVTNGGTAVFQVSATVRSPLSYQWMLNGNDLLGSTNASLVITNVQVPQMGWYSVEVRNSRGSVTTEPVALGIVSTQPESQTVNAGDTATFSVGAVGPGLSYQWRFNGLELAGQTNAALVMTNLGTNQAGFYSVLFHNGGVPFVSQSVELTVPQPGQPGSKLWSFQAESEIFSTPTLAPDGTIYITAKAGSLYSLNTNGGVNWIRALGSETYGAPAITSNGTIIVGAFGTVRAFAPDGTPLWSVPALFGEWTSPAIGLDGTIYAAVSGSSNLVALTSNGATQWVFSCSGGMFSGPAIGADGAIYFGVNQTGDFYAVNSDGTQRWVYRTGNWIYGSPALGADGSVYFVSQDGKLYAFTPAGTKLWELPIPQLNASSPAVGVDGTIYVGTEGNNFVAVRPNGSVAWTNAPFGSTYAAPAVSAAGTIITSSGAGQVAAFAPDGSVRWTYLLGDTPAPWPPRSIPVLARDGTIYVCSRQGFLHAIRGDAPPAESAWPMFRRNAQHTGRMPLAFTAQPTNTSVIAGSSMTFNSAVFSLEPTTLQWRWNGTNLPNATNALLVLSNVQPLNTGSYAVLGSNASGVVLSRPAALVVTVQAPAIQQQPASQTVALEATATFTATAMGSGPLAYQWFRNNQPLPGATAATLVLSNAQLADAGLYALQISNSAGSVTSTGALLTVRPFNGQWVSRDLGDVGLAGSAISSNNTFTVRGAGEDITGTSDAFFFLSQRFAGDGQLVARVASLQNTDPQAEAGLMIRETLQTGARHVFLALSVNQRAEFRRRLLPSHYSIENARPGKVPGWLRLARFGDTFTGHSSTNGVNWELVWWTTVPMAGTVEAGLAVTAHNAGRLATAVFDNATTTGLTPLPGPWPASQPKIFLGGEPLGTSGRQPEGAFKFLIGGNVGNRLAVETSSDLMTWSPLEFRTNTLGVMDFQEALAPTNTVRLYRLRVLSP